MNKTRRLCLFLTIIGVASAIRAAPIPASVPLNYAYNNGPESTCGCSNPLIFQRNLVSFGTYSNTYLAPDGSGSFTQISSVLGGTDPSVSSTTSESVTSTPGLFTAGTIGYLNYYLKITGNQSEIVPLDVAGILSNSWSSNLDTNGDGRAQAEMTILRASNSSVLQVWDLDDSGGLSGGSSISINQTVNLVANRLYEVGLYTFTSLSTQNFSDGNYFMSASIDPTITIDPSFQLPGYSLTISPNVLTSTVPDAPPAVTLVAFSLAGFCLFRRRSYY